ncbi:transglycosylase domain-containing protein [Streptomyces sp. x-80]|uniref:transglycosylase domain-containing protein n=1 Tax=Streptomyces sp. x-80 TaxID=2789282 RepID=UPI00397FE412
MKGTKGRRRFIDYPRRGREGPRRWLPSWRQWLGLFACGVLALAAAFGVIYANVDIPGENALARKEATVYYWADGSQMVSVGAVNRQNVPLDRVPESVQRAVIAAENETFYSDSGVSLKGIARAVVNMVSGEDAQGGSTITQQFVKNTYLSQDQTVTRKVKEFFIALKLSNHRDKKEILRGYLNTSWFGRDSYGIQAAAHAYYGVDVKELNASQGALLAALLKGSELYDPGLNKANHERAEARWKWILDREVETGRMTEAERATYREFPEPRALAKPTSQAGQTGYLIDVANKFIKSATGLTDKDLLRGGYRIYTTFDKARTRRLEKAVTDVRKKTIDPKQRAADTFVEFGAASVRPEDGAILALYGGADATKHFVNNADTSAVPAGSAFKAFVLAAAAQELGERGDGPSLMTAADRRFGTLRGALLNSQSQPFVQAGKSLGLEKIRDMAVATGLRKESMAPLEQTFPLGTSAPSAIRMANAYGTFANEGRHAEPYAVTRMTLDGEPVDGFTRPAPKEVLTLYQAQQMAGALESLGWLMTGRTSGAAQDAADDAAGRPASGVAPAEKPVAAGATLPGDRQKSAWFIGTPSPNSGAAAAGEPTTAITMFRNKPGAPQLLPMQGVGGPETELGTSIPPQIWAAYQGTS